MTDKDLRIQKLTQEIAKWKNRTLECANRACEECDEYSPKNCDACRITRIKEEVWRENSVWK